MHDSDNSQLDKPRDRVIRFGQFELDLQTEELRKGGIRIKLQGQPFRVLSLLVARPGEIVTRAHILQALWGGETFVDFDQSIGAVIRKLRAALGDSATSPRYIETLRHKGYRFLIPCETLACSASAADAPLERRRFASRFHAPIGVYAVVIVALALLAWSLKTAPSRPSAQRTPRNVNAYLAYEKGRYLWRTRAASAVETSIEYFQRALALDPHYAPAYAGIADAYALLNFYSGRQRAAAMERAKSAIHRALQLDRSLAEAHATRAYIRFYYEWDWNGAENAFREAIARNPNYAPAHQWYAEYLFYMERFQEAASEIGRAQELDPQSVVINLQLASPEMFARKYEAAIEKIREALRLDPDFPLAIYMLGTCYEQLGRFDEAIAEYRKITGTKMGLTGLGYACARSGRQKEAREILEHLTSDASQDDLSAYHVARVYAGLGDADQTFAWLKKAHPARDERMVMLRVDPKLDAFRSDRRFGELLRSLGLA